MILLNKKIYHVVENHVIEIHVKQGTTVVKNEISYIMDFYVAFFFFTNLGF